MHLGCSLFSPDTLTDLAATRVNNVFRIPIARNDSEASLRILEAAIAGFSENIDRHCHPQERTMRFHSRHATSAYNERLEDG